MVRIAAYVVGVVLIVAILWAFATQIIGPNNEQGIPGQSTQPPVFSTDQPGLSVPTPPSQ